MIASSALRRVLTEPTPEALWELRGDLLERGVDPRSPLIEIIGEFRAFLEGYRTVTSARELNHLASKLDISAVGGVILEQIFERPEPKDLAMRILTGGISEGLMVLASRQYVRAAEGGLAALFRATAWSLYQRLWEWTTEANPELEAGERRRLIDTLVHPLLDAELPTTGKALLAGRLHQTLVLGRCRP